MTTIFVIFAVVKSASRNQKRYRDAPKEVQLLGANKLNRWMELNMYTNVCGFVCMYTICIKYVCMYVVYIYISLLLYAQVACALKFVCGYTRMHALGTTKQEDAHIMTTTALMPRIIKLQRIARKIWPTANLLHSA